MTIGDNRDYIRVLLYSYYTPITGWGVLLRNSVSSKSESRSKVIGLVLVPVIPWMEEILLENNTPHLMSAVWSHPEAGQDTCGLKLMLEIANVTTLASGASSGCGSKSEFVNKKKTRRASSYSSDNGRNSTCRSMSGVGPRRAFGV